MRQFLFVVYLLSSLIGCDPLPGERISTHNEVNGVTVLDAITTRTVQGAEKFSCRKSSSGQCHFLVYVDRCGDTVLDGAATSPDRDRPRADCMPQTPLTFTVVAGQSAVIPEMDSDFRQCVSIDEIPLAPICSMP